MPEPLSQNGLERSVSVKSVQNPRMNKNTLLDR